MSESKSSLVGILAIILGAAGLGLGSYVFISDLIVGEVQGPVGPQGLPGEDGEDGEEGPQGLPGEDGEDGMDAPGYYCTSASELQQTLDSIGNESGVITITNDITLFGAINISGGGIYIIQGQNPAITIHSGGNWTTFNISSAFYCRIQNLKLNVTDVDLYTRIINIDEVNNNPVYIDNIQFLGDSDNNGTGVYILSDSVSIKNCYMSQLYQAIYQPSDGGNNAKISHNIISDCESHAIELHLNYNSIVDNQIESCLKYGISLEKSNFTKITENLIKDCDRGITLNSANNNTISRNTINSITGLFGIELSYGSSNNIISENQLYNIPWMGIVLSSTLCIMNKIIGNQISNVDHGIYTWGSNSIISENSFYEIKYAAIISDSWYNSITHNLVSGLNVDWGIYLDTDSYFCEVSGNIIDNLIFTSSSDRSGIYVKADYCTVTSNIVTNCNNGGSGSGIGIWISLGSSNCIVDGNIAVDNDKNWVDDGTNTIGDATNNYFP